AREGRIARHLVEDRRPQQRAALQLELELRLLEPRHHARAGVAMACEQVLDPLVALPGCELEALDRREPRFALGDADAHAHALVAALVDRIAEADPGSPL